MDLTRGPCAMKNTLPTLVTGLIDKFAPTIQSN